MAIRLGEAIRNSMLEEVSAAAAGGTLNIYSGTQPANAGTAASGTLLATLTLNSPAFAAASGGAIVVDVDPAVATTGLADGTAGWARLLSSAAVAILDGSVGTTGTDFTVNTTAITTGLAVSLTGGSLTIPAA